MLQITKFAGLATSQMLQVAALHLILDRFKRCKLQCLLVVCWSEITVSAGFKTFLVLQMTTSAGFGKFYMLQFAAYVVLGTLQRLYIKTITIRAGFGVFHKL